MSKGKKERRSKPCESLNYREQTEGWWRKVGGEWARWVIGIKEGACDEHWVFYVSDESLNSTPEINFTVYANQNLDKNLKKTALKIKFIKNIKGTNIWLS